MKEIEIYQLKNTPENKAILFESWETLQNMRITVSPDNYHCAYTGLIPNAAHLDEIYASFNRDDRPNADTMRSLSMSDIIVIRDKTDVHAYYVDLIGFVEVPGFIADLLPLYTETAEYARSNDEMGVYRVSRKENIRCKNAIERGIRDHFDGMHLDHRVSDNLLAEFSPERIEWVLANTIKVKHYDGRFSRSNKDWAETIPVQSESDVYGNFLNYDFCVDSHPAVVDGLVSMLRKDITKLRQQEKAPEEKPERKSVRSRLNEKKQEAAHNNAAAKSITHRKSRDTIE